METKTKSERVKWVASQYMDTHKWGILSEHNDIIVGLSSRLTPELTRQIVHEHNTWGELVEACRSALVALEISRECKFFEVRRVLGRTIAAAEKEEG